MATRSRVQLYEEIRRAAEREGLGVRALSRRFGVHRRDVRRALSSPIPPSRKPRDNPPAAPVLDPWKPLIREWLEADESAPRKQRHTARRVWQRLVEEHGAQVGESTVRHYVARVKAEREVSPATVMVPQRHLLGDEAEVDFGTISVVLAGIPVDLSLFIMRLSASGRSFARAYLNESQEVFLDGHVQAFEHFGGAPARVRYDNLKAAVAKVLQGRTRIESDRFVALRSHYGFDSFFCQPGINGSHEKGGVEGEVGRFRRRHLVPVPRVDTLAALNERLAAACARDDGRRIAHRTITVGEHFALEADALRALPDERFDVSALGWHRVDRHSRVNVRGCYYSVPARLVGRRVEVRVGAETIEVLDGASVIARHARSIKGDQILALDHYLEVLVHKPGALAGATALARARDAGVFTGAHERLWTEARRRLGDRDGTRALIDVLLLHRSTAADAVVAGIDAALSAGSIDAAVIAVEARRAAEPRLAAVVPIGEGLSRFDRPLPSTAHYDQLLEAR